MSTSIEQNSKPLNPKDWDYPYNCLSYSESHGKSLATDLENQRIRWIVTDILGTGAGILATLYALRHKSRNYALLSGALSCVVVLCLLYKSRKSLSSNMSSHINYLKGSYDKFISLQQQAKGAEVDPLTATLAYYREQSEKNHKEYLTLKASGQPSLAMLDRFFYNKACAAFVLAVSQYKLVKSINFSSWVTCHSEKISLPLDNEAYLTFEKTSISFKEMEELTVKEIADKIVVAMKAKDSIIASKLKEES